MKTKILYATFILLLLASLTACEQEAAQPEATATTAPTTVAVVTEPTATTAPTEAAVVAEPTTAPPATEATDESQVVYQVVDTGQTQCYDDSNAIPCPEEGEPFYGQDAQYASSQLSYIDNGRHHHRHEYRPDVDPRPRRQNALL